MAFNIYKYIAKSFSKLNRTDCNIAFVSMCRMCGIPARWQGGWALKEGKATGHDWAMVHLLPYGWIYVDADFGAEALSNNLSCSHTDLFDFFFGNIDPCMVPTASVPKADLYPAKDYERADEIFNIYGEVELVPDKMGSEGHFEGYGLKKKDFTSEILLKY
jgi:hypothetical protein